MCVFVRPLLQVACGYYFSIVVAADGSVYSWGEGSEGQLGLGFSADFQVDALHPRIACYVP